MRLPRWFPQFMVHVEMRPVFYAQTNIMFERYEMATVELLTLDLSLFRWSWQFRIFKRFQ